MRASAIAAIIWVKRDCRRWLFTQSGDTIAELPPFCVDVAKGWGMDSEKKNPTHEGILPEGDFDLPSVLQMFRAARDDAVGPEIGHQMNRATAELAASDPLTSMPAVGDRAPLFELPSQNGDIVRLQQRLATGASGPGALSRWVVPLLQHQPSRVSAALDRVAGVGRIVGCDLIAKRDDSLTTAERNALPIDVLSDVGSDRRR